jgi:hypothetical protein
MSETADDFVKSPDFRLDYWECAGGRGRWGIGVAADILAIEARLAALEESSRPVQSAKETAAAAANDPVREGEPAASDGPGDGWRFVNVGERVERLDECYIDGEWRKVSHCGHLTTAWYDNLCRRRITPAEAVPDDAAMRILDESSDIDDWVRRIRESMKVAEMRIRELAPDAAGRRLAERETANKEVNRLRLTDEEREAIEWAAREADEWDEEDTPEIAAHAEALRGLAKRLF